MKLLYCGLWMISFVPSCQAAEVADMVLLGGNIITLDVKKPNVQAMAIKDGRVQALGSTALIQAYAGAKTQSIDLQGATAIPGFIDGHAHLTGIGYAQTVLDVKHVLNWDEVIKKVSHAVTKHPAGTWIIGRGWHQDKWNTMPEGAIEGYPNHVQLSAVSPQHPVMLIHASGHALFANARAMELAGVNKETLAPAGGKLVRDKLGSATGVFEENASDLIQAAHQKSQANRTAKAKRANLIQLTELGIKDCLAKGITSFHDAGVPFSTLDVYKEMADKGELDIRLWVMAGDDNDTLKKNLAQYKLVNYGNGFLTLGGIKRYVDGALGSRGAWLLKAYDDLPGHSGQTVTPLKELAETAAIALAHRLQLCVHAIGDRGNREVLTLFEAALQGKNRRWRIEHAQHLNPADIGRFSQLGVIASMQGIHCTSDAAFVEKRLGTQRAASGAYVWRSLVDSGAIVTNGTDAPVEDVAPLASYYAMITRKSLDGTSFYPGQVLQPLEALRAYTLNNAYAAYQESEKGSLEVGKLADITILSRDITMRPFEEIHKTKVLYTIVGGDIKYRHP